ncbi:MAG: transketolase family protein [Oligoflexia bacterium]
MANPAKATRQSFGEALARLGAEHPEIVVLDADLSKSTKSDLFAKKFPERFFEMGIQEAHMIGAASGMAFSGKLPFLCSFGAFLTGRYDTVRLSAVYSGANLRLIGTHAGLGIGDDGHSQMGLEDVALMRALPTMGVFQPMDDAETHAIMDHLVKQYRGPAYLRLTRQALPDYSSQAAPFGAGKLRKIAQFGSGSVEFLAIGSGAGVAEAMGAAEILSKQGRTTQIWNCHTLKPFDAATLLELVSSLKPKKIITVEDHSVIGGLGSCVAEVLAEAGSSVRLNRYGCQDQFGESGEPVELFEKHGFSAAKIAESLA